MAQASDSKEQLNFHYQYVINQLDAFVQCLTYTSV